MESNGIWRAQRSTNPLEQTNQNSFHESIINTSVFLRWISCWCWGCHVTFCKLTNNFAILIFLGPQWACPSIFPARVVPCHCSRTLALRSSWLVQALRVQRVWFASGVWHTRYLVRCSRPGVWLEVFVLSNAIIRVWSRWWKLSMPKMYQYIVVTNCRCRRLSSLAFSCSTTIILSVRSCFLWNRRVSDAN